MIPNELITLKQWVCADTEKRPVNPRTGKMASPTDSRTWGTYEEAKAFSLKNSSMFPHVSFVLSKDDPYCIIDLDPPENDAQAQRHSKIIQAFDSYTEISQSGNGVHIIVKATTPKGFKKDNVEVYSSARHMITTGNVLRELKPVNDYQPLVNKLILEIDKIHRTKVEFIDTSNIDIFDIEELHNQLLDDPYLNAEYELLCNGDWQGRLNYQSHSEPDFNMAMMICEHTDSDALGKALFGRTKMFRPAPIKHAGYLDYTFTRARDKTIPKPEVDLTALKQNMISENDKVEKEQAEVKKFYPHLKIKTQIRIVICEMHQGGCE